MRKALLPLFLRPAVALAQPLTASVQLVHGDARSPRPLFREARASFEAVGIHLRLDRIVRKRLPRAVAPDAALLVQYAPEFVALSRPGVRTVLFVPPPRDPWGRPYLTGAAPICNDRAVMSRPRQFPAGRVPWVLAHELGHSLGASHDVGENQMNPWVVPAARQFEPRAVAEMEECLGWGREGASAG